MGEAEGVLFVVKGGGMRNLVEEERRRLRGID